MCMSCCRLLSNFAIYLLPSRSCVLRRRATRLKYTTKGIKRLHAVHHASRNRDGSIRTMWKPKYAPSGVQHVYHLTRACPSFASLHRCIDDHGTTGERAKWAPCTGSVSVPNTASTRKASSRNGRPRVAIARTCSFTKPTTSTTFRVPSSSISSLGYVSRLALPCSSVVLKAATR